MMCVIPLGMGAPFSCGFCDPSASHFAYDTCTPNAYVDFKFTVDEQSSKNLIVEVEDLEDSVNPTALSLYLYNISISEVGLCFSCTAMISFLLFSRVFPSTVAKLNMHAFKMRICWVHQV